MTTSLQIPNVSVSASYNYSTTNALGTPVTDSGSILASLSAALVNGTGAGKAQVVYYNKKSTAGSNSLAASGHDDIDLAGSLLDAFGNTVTFSKVKGFIVMHNNTATASSISVGGAASNQFINWISTAAASVKLNNGDVLALFGSGATGWAVTAGTGDLLRITNNDGVNAADYTIFIYGE